MTRALLAGLWVLASAAAFAADDPSLRVVEACRAKLDARADLGLDRVQRRCPELLPALERAPWRELLPTTLRQEDISADSLRALVVLIRASQSEVPAPATLERDTLEPVLAALGAQGQQGATRWERLKRWFRAKLEDRDEDDGAGWLGRLTSRLRTSEGIADALTYAGYLAVTLLVSWVILTELRAAGVFGGWRRVAARRNPAAEWRRRLMLADVTAAPLAERPGMLLRLLGEALTRAHRLPAADGLTAPAIARRARLDTDEDREQLERVARVADDARYAPRAPADATLEETVGVAKSLLARVTRSER
jgi:hypothetical protein